MPLPASSTTNPALKLPDAPPAAPAAVPDAPPQAQAVAIAPRDWSALQWIGVARVVALMAIPLVGGIIGGVWWFAGFREHIELEMQANRARLEVQEKALANLATVPLQLAALTARFDVWAQTMGLPIPKTPKKDADE